VEKLRETECKKDALAKRTMEGSDGTEGSRTKESHPGKKDIA
jgi:hypothetical protein